LTKDKDATDNAQVPAGGAAVVAYLQGATVKTDANIPAAPGSGSVEVHSVGRFSVGDSIIWLRNDATQAGSAFVVATLDETHLTLGSATQLLQLKKGDRLVPNVHPTVFSESTGQEILPSSPVLLTDSSGRTSPAFLEERFFDASISIAGHPTRWFFDQSAGHTVSLFDVRDWGVQVGDGDGIQRVLDMVVANGGPIEQPPFCKSQRTYAPPLISM
jgi:hypothetical protein